MVCSRWRSPIALAADPLLAEAQNNPPPAATPAPAETAAPAPAAAPAELRLNGRRQTTRLPAKNSEKLLAPIALYPDPFARADAACQRLSRADRPGTALARKNKALVAKNDYSGIDNQNWDPAKALARFPDVIKLMSADLDWTTDLGDAEVNQPQDVAEVIQAAPRQGGRGRNFEDDGSADGRAREGEVPQGAGAPQGSTAPQAAASYISIQPTDPSTVYVPTYNTAAVYQPYTGIAPLLGFGAGIAVGALWNNNYWNWGTGATTADLGRLFGLEWRRQ